MAFWNHANFKPNWPEDEEEIVSGPRLVPQSEVQEIAEKIDPFVPRISWSGLELPETLANQHFCIIGASRTGKTHTLQVLMRSILPRIVPGAKKRALIYDGKLDTISALAAMGIGNPIILNPFDARGVPWDMAKDIVDSA